MALHSEARPVERVGDTSVSTVSATPSGVENTSSSGQLNDAPAEASSLLKRLTRDMVPLTSTILPCPAELPATMRFSPCTFKMLNTPCNLQPVSMPGTPAVPDPNLTDDKITSEHKSVEPSHMFVPVSCTAAVSRKDLCNCSAPVFEWSSFQEMHSYLDSSRNNNNINNNNNNNYYNNNSSSSGRR